jgi:hypothetical protein
MDGNGQEAQTDSQAEGRGFESRFPLQYYQGFPLLRFPLMRFGTFLAGSRGRGCVLERDTPISHRPEASTGARLSGPMRGQTFGERQ